jgi:hypothetical protein
MKIHASLIALIYSALAASPLFAAQEQYPEKQQKINSTERHAIKQTEAA